jgi:hypothetical protein
MLVQGLGLKQMVFSPIFPLPVAAPALVFAFYEWEPEHPLMPHLADEAGVDVGSITIAISECVPEKPAPFPAASAFVEGAPMALWTKGWVFMPVRADQWSLVVQRPGIYKILLREDERETLIGQIVFSILNPEPHINGPFFRRTGVAGRLGSARRSATMVARPMP